MNAYIRVRLVDANNAPVVRSVCVDNNCVIDGTDPKRKVITVESGIHRIWLDGLQDYEYPSLPPQPYWHDDIQTTDPLAPLLITFKQVAGVGAPETRRCCQDVQP